MYFQPFQYMEWAKKMPALARFNLTGSGMPQASLAHLPVSLSQIRLDCGNNPYGDQQLLEKLSKIYHVPEDHILVTFGTSMANFLLGALFLEPNDIALVETPTYEALLRVPEFFKARIKRVPRLFENGFQFDLPQFIEQSQNAKIAFLTNLHNPSHSLIPVADIQKLAEAELDTFFVFDEVYLDFIPKAERRIAHLFSHRFFTTGSLTKVYGFGGLRVGWIIGPPEWIQKAHRLMNLMEVLSPAPTSHLACLLLEERPALLQKAYHTAEQGWARTKALLEELQLKYFPPAGGLSCLVYLPEHLKEDVAFASRLMIEEETLIVPGNFFEIPGTIRISYGSDLNTLNQGLERLKLALTQWSHV